MTTATDVARSLYTALADEDADALFALLTDDFEGTVSAGMPRGVGGDHHGRVAMITDVWGRIAADYDIAAEPAEFLEVADGAAQRVVVLGTYRGRAHRGGSAVDAAPLDAEDRTHRDQCFLEESHVPDDVDRLGQFDDRVPDELTGTVPGDLSAAVHIDDRRSVDGTIAGFGSSPRGVDGRVLEQ